MKQTQDRMGWWGDRSGMATVTDSRSMDQVFRSKDNGKITERSCMVHPAPYPYLGMGCCDFGKGVGEVALAQVRV